jgi:hypothetical protein
VSAACGTEHHALGSVLAVECPAKLTEEGSAARLTAHVSVLRDVVVQLRRCRGVQRRFIKELARPKPASTSLGLPPDGGWTAKRRCRRGRPPAKDIRSCSTIIEGAVIAACGLLAVPFPRNRASSDWPAILDTEAKMCDDCRPNYYEHDRDPAKAIMTSSSFGVLTKHISRRLLERKQVSEAELRLLADRMFGGS